MKTNDEILKQQYITAKDIQSIIPKLGYITALRYIEELRKEMKEKGYFVPEGKTKVALTKLFKKKFGIWKAVEYGFRNCYHIDHMCYIDNFINTINH